MVLGVEEILNVGEDAYFSSISLANSYGVTFEDDLVTGYFYAVNTMPDFQILDALHIYDVANVIDKDKPSELQIVWSDDGFIASLLINNYCHAIFDFENNAGYCRTAFPEAHTEWNIIKQRKLTDNLINDIFSNHT